MLKRKMWREIRQNFGQFFSIFVLSFLATFIFAGFQSNVVGGRSALNKYFNDTKIADGWLYGEGFTEENLEAVRALDFIEEAQLRTYIKGSAPDFDGAQVELYLQEENLVSKPRFIEGEEYDPKDTDGVWLCESFANARDIKVGDKFVIDVEGISLTKEVKGIVEMPEYLFRKADTDLDTVFENIAIAYVANDGLPYTQLIVRTKDGNATDYEEEIAEAIDNNYAVMVNDKSIVGIERVKAEFDQHEAFSFTFAVIFVGVAILVIATAMGRMVDKQRTQIGTLNALGYKNGKIIIHYLSYSFILSTIGAALGLILGMSLVGNMMVDMFGYWYLIPDWNPGANTTYILVALMVIVACTGSAYFTCRKVLRVKPSEALRPAPPKKGKHCIFEKLPFWNKLGFKAQYNLRDISRSKLRAFMGVIGTATGMLFMVYAVGCFDLVDYMMDWNFGKIQKYQTQITFDGSIDPVEADRIRDELDGELIMSEVIEVANEPYAVSSERSKGSLTVLEGKGMYNLTDDESNIIPLEEGQIALSHKIAEELSVKIGDKVYWHIYEENTWYEAEIGVINRSPEMQGVTCLRSDFEAIDREFTPYMLLTNQKLSEYEHENVATVFTMDEMMETFESNWSSIYMLVGMMIALSIIMIVVVLYNSGNLSFNERVKEFATLKVMGFQSAHIRKLLSIQNLWLSAIGCILGAPLGQASMELMMNSNGDQFDYVITIPAQTYIISAIVVLVISMSVSFMFAKRIKKLDMVEVLKGVE